MSYVQILYGLGTGVFASLAGYIKNLPDENKSNSIDFYKLLPALIVGGVAGVYSVVKGIDLLSAQNFLASTSIVFIVNYLVSMFKKYMASRKVIA